LNTDNVVCIEETNHNTKLLATKTKNTTSKREKGKMLQTVLSNGWPLAIATHSRLRPQIGYGYGQDFDQRAAAIGCAMLSNGYCKEKSLKLELKNLNVFTTLIYQCPMRRFPHESIRPSK
jgi:hypothetical protein